MNKRNQKRNPSDAASWDARLRTADCTADERAAFKAWCQMSPENQSEFDRLRSHLSDLRSAGNAPEIRALREWAVESTGPSSSKSPRRANSVWFALAAAISAIAVAIWLVNVPPDSSTTDLPRMAEFSTAVGERSTATLEDGSVATLNTNTQLAVDFSDGERRVILIQGQVLFDVAKNPDRPFVVIAGKHRIVAVGTIFDVRLEQDDVNVVLVEGVVEVSGNSNSSAAVSMLPPIRMAAGQRLRTSDVTSRMPPVVEEADTERATIWTDGRVVFEDTALVDAVHEMNRYSLVKIIVDGHSIEKLRVGGTFRTGRQANFVNSLEAYYPLVSQRLSDGTIVVRSE